MEEIVVYADEGELLSLDSIAQDNEPEELMTLSLTIPNEVSLFLSNCRFEEVQVKALKVFDTFVPLPQRDHVVSKQIRRVDLSNLVFNVLGKDLRTNPF